MKPRSLWMLLLTACMAGRGLALEAGTAVADITPDVQAFKVPLAGYGARMGRPATGVHDPLHAKVLYLRDGATRMALITCDLRSSTPEFKRQIVERCPAPGFTLDNVFVACSHTHDGPSMYPEKFWQMQFGKYDPKIVEIMSAAVAEALAKAVQNAVPVKVGYGAGRAEAFVHNRRFGYDAEKRKAAQETPVTEPVFRMLRVDGLDGSAKAVVVNFACHPTILSEKNMAISAEWPGVLQAEVEKAIPGAVAMFTNGAEGDQSPEGVQGTDEFERMRDFGTRLAAVMAPVAQAIETRPDCPIAYCRITPELPPLSFPEGAKTKYATYRKAAQEGLPRRAEIQILRIGPAAIVGLPGEPIMEVGQAVRQAVERQGLEHVLVAGLANDYIGYLVNEKEYAHGGYEVESRSYYGPGLGAFLAEHAGKAAATIGSHGATGPTHE